MRINKDNYEMYFLDYHEGNMPAELVAELFVFLEDHPELKTEFENFENISLPDQPAVPFPDKNLLKKGFIDGSNYTRFFIAHVEGTLGADEKLMVDDFLISNPQYKKELALFGKTKLQPDLSIIYPGKKKLKKPIPLFAQSKTWYYMAAAACILFFLGMIIINQQKTDGPQMAYRNIPVATDRADSSVNNPDEQKGNKLQKGVETEMQGNTTNTEKHRVEKTIRPALHNAEDKQPAGRKLHENSGNHEVSVKIEKDVPELKEEIAYLPPVEINLVIKEPEMTLANTNKEYRNSFYHTLTASESTGQSYLTIGEAVKQYSHYKLTQVMNDPPLTDDLLSERVPGKIKGIKLIGWCYEKITGKKVDVKTSYSPLGELTAYRVTAGRFQFGKTFASR